VVTVFRDLLGVRPPPDLGALRPRPAAGTPSPR
jgi:hypothetical protein